MTNDHLIGLSIKDALNILSQDGREVRVSLLEKPGRDSDEREYRVICCREDGLVAAAFKSKEG